MIKFKSYLGIFLSAILALAFGACSDSYNGQLEFTTHPNSVTVDQHDLDFSYRVGSQYVQVVAQGKWEASASDAWINVTPTSGAEDTQRITVSVTLNTLSEKRRGTVQVGREKITIEQDCAYLTSNAESVSLGESGEAQTLQLLSNAKWKASLVDALTGETISWLTVSPSAGEGDAAITLKAGRNTGTLRLAYLQFVGTDSDAKSERIIVQQQGTSATTIEIPMVSSDGAVLDELKHPCPYDYAWTASVQDGVDWLHVTPQQGNSTSVPFLITVDRRIDVEPSRSSFIELSYMNGMKFQLLVTQDRAGFYLETNQYDFFAKGGESQPITVQSDGNFEVSSDAGWLYGRVSGNLLVLVASENTSASMRTATLTLRQTGKGADAKATIITVRQAGVNGTFTFDGFGDDQTWN